MLTVFFIVNLSHLAYLSKSFRLGMRSHAERGNEITTEKLLFNNISRFTHGNKFFRGGWMDTYSRIKICLGRSCFYSNG